MIRRIGARTLRTEMFSREFRMLILVVVNFEHLRSRERVELVAEWAVCLFCPED